MHRQNKSFGSNHLKKAVTVFFILFAFSFFCRPVSASPFEIHAIYLKQGLGGDAVLVRSGGNYILMDTGKVRTSKVVVSYLKKKKIKKLSVYISHADEDHMGGLKAVAKHFKITSLYMPKRNIASDSKNNKKQSVSKLYADIRAIARKEKAKLIELNRGASFKIGDARFDVIGPLETVTDAEYEKIQDCQTGDDPYGRNIARYMKTKGSAYYTNAMSLSTMITCNHVKYLTMGDTSSTMEAYIARLYDLNADILKMSHHALSSSSTTLLRASTPSFVFCCTSHPASSTAAARKRVIKVTGRKPLLTGYLKKNIVYTVSNSGQIKVKLTR